MYDRKSNNKKGNFESQTLTTVIYEMTIYLLTE